MAINLNYEWVNSHLILCIQFHVAHKNGMANILGNYAKSDAQKFQRHCLIYLINVSKTFHSQTHSEREEEPEKKARIYL